MWPVVEVLEEVSRRAEINESVADFLSNGQEFRTLLMHRTPGLVLQEQRTFHTAVGSGDIRLRHPWL